MASISSTNSASSANSLGNTSLRGFGGMVSGIDRDSIIEQMTLGTTTKINKVKTQITELGWKQEAYRSISDKILDLTDNYTSFSSSKTLVDPNLFARNIINVNGVESAAKFVKVSGNSDMIDSLSIKAVKQLASAAMQQSKSYSGSLVTGLDADKLAAEADITRESALQGSSLTFKFDIKGLSGENLKDLTVRFEDTYWTEEKIVEKDADGNEVKDDDGNPVYVTKKDADGNVVKDDDGNPVYETEKVEHAIDYTLKDETSLGKLVDQLNLMLADHVINLPGENEGDDPKEVKLTDMIRFAVSDDGGKITLEGEGEYADKVTIGKDSAALGILFGDSYKAEEDDPDLTISDFKSKIDNSSVVYDNGVLDNPENSIVKRHSGFETLVGATATFSYNGDVQNVMLLTKDEADQLRDKTSAEQLEGIRAAVQGRLDRVYGTGNIAVNVKDRKLTFDKTKPNSFLAMAANNTVQDVLGIKSGASSSINIDETLLQNNLNLSEDFKKELEKEGGELKLKINDTEISGITKDMTIDEILTKINKSDAGVTASYVESTGQFVLVANKTGSGRDIKLENDLAEALFGNKDEDGKEIGSIEGKDAEIVVNYGNGVDVTLTRSSNSFNLEGLNVTVSGTFGGDLVDKSTRTRGNVLNDKGELDDSAFRLDKDGNYIDRDGKRVDANGYLIEQIWVSDATETVTFDAKADVDKATERVKGFFEDYNALVSEVYKQLTTRKDRSYGALTDEQKAEMTEDEIEKWETKAKEGILYNDSNMEALNSDLENMLTKWMNSGISYADLEKIGITYVSDWSGGASTINFDEDKFRRAMEDTPELVSDIFTGTGSGRTGLVQTLDNTLTTYATRYAKRNDGSYGRLIEEAGSEKLPTTEMKNYIYNELKSMNERLESLKSLLKTKQERYIKQFTSMESLVNQYNSQSGYLSQITG